MSAELWDVRNAYLYLAAGAEAEQSQQRAPVFIDGDAAVKTAKRRATELLARELEGQFAGLHAGT